MFIVTLGYGDFGWNINKYHGHAHLYLVRKSSSFDGGLGGQMTLTLQDKREAKVNYDLAKIEFDLLMIRVPSAVLIRGCT